MGIELNKKNKIKAGLLIGAVLIFVCFILIFMGVHVSANSACAAEVPLPTIVTQPVGVGGVYRADLPHLSVEVSHIDPTVSFEYAWYKEVTGSSDLLVGTEMIFPINGVGDNGKYYCVIVARDTDNDISEPITTNTVEVSLSKIYLRATIANAESFFGEELANLSCTLTLGTLINGDKAEDLNIVLTKTAGINAGTYRINGTNSDENYYIDFTAGTYTIKPKKIDIIIANQTSEYGENIKPLGFGLYQSVLAYDDTTEDLDITLTKESGINAGRYAISGFCGNTNYEVTFIMGLYTITKRPVAVNFEGYSDLVYNGKIQSISCALLGSLLPNEEANIYITYNKTPKNAGEYIATAVVDNNNYGIVLGDKKTFTIAKKALKIVADDLVINFGQTPKFTYSFIGFAEGESADDLLALPIIAGTEEFVSVGVYEITPSNASSLNYSFVYEKGILQINKTGIASLEGIKGSASGSFAPDTIIKVTTAQSHDFSKLGSFVAASYGVDIEGEVYSDSYKVVLEDVSLSSIFMRVVVIDAAGTKRSPRSFEYKNGTLTVETTTSGTIVVYNDYLPIAIVAAVALIIALGVMAFLAKDRMRAKAMQKLAQEAMEDASYYVDEE